MKQGRTDRDWAMVSVMAFIAGAFLVWALLSKHPPQPRPPINIDWPAWVQAVGSVGAILAAIAIAAHERAVSKIDLERQERLASNARYTRGHRAIRRFHKIIAKLRERETIMMPGEIIHPIERVALSDAMLSLEHDCHLMGAAGAACLNVIRTFEDAQELINNSMLRAVNGEKYFGALRFSEQYCEEAIKHFVAYLATAKN